METIEQYQQTGREIWNELRLATYPVAVKYIKDESEIPEDFIQPSKVGESWSLCQAFTYARKKSDLQCHDQGGQRLCSKLCCPGLAEGAL